MPFIARMTYDPPRYVLSTNQTNPVNWGLDRIDQRERRGFVNNYGNTMYFGNGTTAFGNNNYYYERTGSGVHVYVFDTGINLGHSDLSGRFGTGFDAVTPGGNGEDCQGHGTYVATIAAGTTYGVAKQATVHPIRVVDCFGDGTASQFVAGASWLLANASTPAVVVAGLNYGPPSVPEINNIVDSLIARGISVTVSAGNGNADACNESPSGTSNAVTVGASTEQDRRKSDSNWGPCVDIWAPGTNITAGWAGASNAGRTDGGTSAAAPFVAGVVATYLQRVPSASPADIANKLYESYTGAIPGADLQGGWGGIVFSWIANDQPFAEFRNDSSTYYTHLYAQGASWGLNSYSALGITSYEWFTPGAFPGSSQTGSWAYASYDSGGEKEVHLTVTDTQGRTAFIKKYIWVNY